MHVIAGTLKGRQLQTPKGHRTHPMSEKVRGGLFNTLGDISGLSVLDGFAGSGALSFEAISRGAKHATAVDIDKNATQAMLESAEDLGVMDKIKIIRANVSGWSDNNPSVQFDLVFAAPPYDNLQPKLIEKLTRHTAKNGLYVLDWPGKEKLPSFIPTTNLPAGRHGYQLLSTKSYGDAQLVFYRRIS